LGIKGLDPEELGEGFAVHLVDRGTPPSTERGPVLRCALRRLAASCFCDAINKNGAALVGGCPESPTARIVAGDLEALWGCGLEVLERRAQKDFKVLKWSFTGR
jgi:hypothetical protein